MTYVARKQAHSITWTSLPADDDLCLVVARNEAGAIRVLPAYYECGAWLDTGGEPMAPTHAVLHWCYAQDVETPEDDS